MAGAKPILHSSSPSLKRWFEPTVVPASVSDEERRSGSGKARRDRETNRSTSVGLAAAHQPPVRAEIRLASAGPRKGGATPLSRFGEGVAGLSRSHGMDLFRSVRLGSSPKTPTRQVLQTVLGTARPDRKEAEPAHDNGFARRTGVTRDPQPHLVPTRRREVSAPPPRPFCVKAARPSVWLGRSRPVPRALPQVRPRASRAPAASGSSPRVPRASPRCGR